MNPAIFFAPDGYAMDGPRLMGRQAAGNGFLRTAIQNRGDEPVRAAVNSTAHRDAFRAFVAAQDPNAPTEVIPADDTESLARIGLYYWPDVNLGPIAWRRLWRNPAAYSLCGVTHTISSSAALGMLARHPFEPLMAWDAIMCTSSAAVEVVNGIYDEAQAQHRWRTRGAEALPRPLTPKIPLGVHCDDYRFSDADRAAARVELGLADDDIALVAPGRISVSGKAHPYPLMAAVGAVAAETDARLTLVFAGIAATSTLLESYLTGAAALCPGVRVVIVDGKDAARYRNAWAAADIFISLADSIQETFGLTPIEAMASGLPTLVSDWNGYRDTVRDGIDGFRIPTWAQPPGSGQSIARAYEVGNLDSNEYHYRANAGVSLDMAVLRERLAALVTDPELRRRLGAAGQARAREDYDWKVIWGRYQALWAELTAIRERAAADPQTAAWLARAPRGNPAHLGPFDTFRGFPTRHVTPETVVSMGRIPSPDAYAEAMTLEIANHWRVVDVVFQRVHAALAGGPLTVAELGETLGFGPALVAEVVARLAKFEAVTLSPP
ncbi:MAG: glycosyltransferase family 4 protein [Proteobacteria bacterium]|nr:glycosyltransferase family 4 protein [Pseudomonadota bacterium]